MFLWQASLGDRGTNPRALESRERPSRWHPQERTITSHALARRLRSKRHDNAKEESPTCPFLRRSIEPLNSCHRSRNIAERPADTVGEYSPQAAMDLQLRTAALTGPPPINIDFRKDAIGGSASNALFCLLQSVSSSRHRYMVSESFSMIFSPSSA